MDPTALRQLLENVAGLISTMHRHVDLGEECERLGLPTPPDDGSKHERVKASLAALPDADLPEVAEKILASQLPVDAARYQSGLGVRSLGLLISPTWYTTSTNSGRSWIVFGWWATTRSIIGGELSVSSESTDVQFFSLDDVPGLTMHESIRLRIQDYVSDRPPLLR